MGTMVRGVAGEPPLLSRPDLLPLAARTPILAGGTYHYPGSKLIIHCGLWGNYSTNCPLDLRNSAACSWSPRPGLRHTSIECQAKASFNGRFSADARDS